MSDVFPSVPAPEPARRRTVPTGVVIALATAVLSILVTIWAMTHFRSTATAAPQTVASPAPAPTTKVIVSPPVASDPATLTAREEMLAAQLGALEQRTSAVTGEAANAYGNATRAEALLIAFAARRAIEAGRPLGYLDGQLRSRFGASQPNEVATIATAAAHPVSLEDLRLGLDQIGPQLALGPSNGGGWGGAIWRGLNSLIVIHPRNVPSPVPGERLNRIRRLLALGQVEAAVAEVDRLPGAAQATGWRDGARQYVAVRKALEAIEAAAIEGRAAAPAAPVPAR